MSEDKKVPFGLLSPAPDPDELDQNMRNQIRFFEQKKKELRSQWGLLLAQVNGYTQERKKLFLRRLREAGLTWCCECHSLFKVEEVSHFSLRGIRYGYLLPSKGGGVEAEHIPFSEMIRVCSLCAREGGYTPGEKSEFSRPASRRGLIRELTLTEIENPGDDLIPLPEEVIEKHGRRFLLPPRIVVQLRQGSLSEKEVVMID